LKDMVNYLGDMDIIFSTVPDLVLGEKKLNKIRKDTVIIDLASSPGSVDFACAKGLGLQAILELGIPSKVAPKSAAMYLKESIDNVIYNN